MSKIFALYTNEMIKLSRKLSVWILVILMAAASFCIPILLHRNTSIETSVDYSPIEKADITKDRDTEMNTLGDPNRYVEHTTLRFTIENETVEFFATRLKLDEDMLRSYSNLACDNAILTNYDFDKYPITSTYLSYISYAQYFASYYAVCELNMEPFGSRKNEWYQNYVFATENLDLSKEAFFNHDYSALESLITRENVQPSYKRLIHRLASLDPEGKLGIAESEHICEAIVKCQKYQDNLNMGVYQEKNTYRPLTSGKREQLEDSVKILNYQIDNSKLPSISTFKATKARQFAQRAARFLLIIMLVVIAGSSISQEIATGSIKSLIIAPAKRWKIFTAKLMALTTWVLAGSILITAISTISTGICYGFSSLSPYYYCSGGKVTVMSNYLFTLLFFLADNIPLFVYLLAAFTISCLSRNTGIAVGISTALVLTSGISSTLTQLFGQQRWIDFLPFSNMNLVGKIFPYYDLCGFIDSEDAGILGISSNSLPLSFSLCYLAVLIVILLLIAYDGFVRSDIQ